MNRHLQMLCLALVCCCPAELVAAVFNAVKDIIIRNSLRDAGLN